MQFGNKEVRDPYRPITQAPRMKYQYLGDAKKETTTPNLPHHVQELERNDSRSGQSHEETSTCHVCSSDRILGPGEGPWCSECRRTCKIAEGQIASLLRSGDITMVKHNGTYGLKTDVIRENAWDANLCVPCIFKCDCKVWIAHKKRLYNVAQAKLCEDSLVNLKGIRLRPVLYRRNDKVLFGVIRRGDMVIIAESVTESERAAFAKLLARAMEFCEPWLVATTLRLASMTEDNIKLIAEQVRWNGNSAYLSKRRGNWNDYKQLTKNWYNNVKKVEISTSELLARLNRDQLAEFINLPTV